MDSANEFGRCRSKNDMMTGSYGISSASSSGFSSHDQSSLLQVNLISNASLTCLYNYYHIVTIQMIVQTSSNKQEEDNLG
ncbi:hypothetical protein DYY67_1195 [Candidatus Nitrosotalea sp. TS]|nr:hypothetical protein [Candidatus Nitrosotalea sp. TS]